MLDEGAASPVCSYVQPKDDRVASPTHLPNTGTRTHIARFGVFELNVSAGELRKQGARVRLQGKPLQVLLALLERPGEIVTRQELQRRLWPKDVFVDFEAGLNTAANRLRVTLGDSATNPHFIETLARVGYRFIGHVEWFGSPATSSPAYAPESQERTAAVAPSGGNALAPPTETVAAGPFLTTGAPVLEDVAGEPSPSTQWSGGSPQADAVRPKVWRWTAAGTAAAVLAVVVLGLAKGFAPSLGEASPLDFRPITFDRGLVWGARFSADGREVIYSANWGNERRQLYAVTPSNPEARALMPIDDRLVAISRSGELALLADDGNLPIAGGSLWRARSDESTRTPVGRNIMAADWLADGSTLAVARAVDGTNVLEFPVGTPRHRTSGWIGGIRVAPDGTRLAFVEHPVRNDNGGHVRVLDATGTVRTLSEGWANVGGLAWHSTTGEVWFTASRDGSSKSLWAVDDVGRVRVVAKGAGDLTLRDLSSDGRALASSEATRLEMFALTGAAPQTDITLFDWSRVADVSADGRFVLFDESGAAGGADYLIYLHDLQSGTATRIGEGRAMALSADGQFVLALGSTERTRLRLLPIRGGVERQLPTTGLEYQWARYFPDGKTILALANEPGQPLRVYVQPPDGAPFPLTSPTMVRNAAISPDGSRVALLTASNALAIHTVSANSEPQNVPQGERLAPLLWAADDWIYVQRLGAYTQLPTELARLHLPTGRLESWRTIGPTDTVGVNALTKVMMSANLQTVVFNYRRSLSELFVTNGPAQ